MKFRLLLVWFAALSLVGGQVTELTDDERDELLERLKVLRDASDSQIEARFRVAVSAYRSAMASDEATLALYLNCVEKLDFSDQDRPAADFREWRRTNDERLKDSAFQRVLRHQLRWMVLTLQAASENADATQLASSAREIIDSIVSDAGNLRGHQNILNQSVVGSHFARAYSISNVDVENWVLAPGQIGAIYDRIIMPQYRSASRVDSLRNAWIKRIQQEIRLVEAWRSEERRTGGDSAQESPETEKFRSEELPKLQWQMEVDLFKHGDPRGAATRMISHIESNAAHGSVREWFGELEKLLAAQVSSEAVLEAESP